MDILPYLDKLTWIGIVAIIAIFAEIYFGLYIQNKKREFKESLHSYVVCYKIISYLLGGFTFGIFCLIAIYSYEAAWVFGVATIVSIVYAANYLWAKAKVKSEEEKEYYDKVYKNTKYRIGDKVRVRKGIYEGSEIESNASEETVYEMNEDSQKLSKSQKLLTVKDVDGDGDLILVDVDGNIYSGYPDKALKSASRRKRR